MKTYSATYLLSRGRFRFKLYINRFMKNCTSNLNCISTSFFLLQKLTTKTNLIMRANQNKYPIIFIDMGPLKSMNYKLWIPMKTQVYISLNNIYRSSNSPVNVHSHAEIFNVTKLQRKLEDNIENNVLVDFESKSPQSVVVNNP